MLQISSLAFNVTPTGDTAGIVSKVIVSKVDASTKVVEFALGGDKIRLNLNQWNGNATITAISFTRQGTRMVMHITTKDNNVYSMSKVNALPFKMSQNSGIISFAPFNIQTDAGYTKVVNQSKFNPLKIIKSGFLYKLPPMCNGAFALEKNDVDNLSLDYDKDELPRFFIQGNIFGQAIKEVRMQPSLVTILTQKTQGITTPENHLYCLGSKCKNMKNTYQDLSLEINSIGKPWIKLMPYESTHMIMNNPYNNGFAGKIKVELRRVRDQMFYLKLGGKYGLSKIPSGLRIEYDKSHIYRIPNLKYIKQLGTPTKDTLLLTSDARAYNGKKILCIGPGCSKTNHIAKAFPGGPNANKIYMMPEIATGDKCNFDFVYDIDHTAHIYSSNRVIVITKNKDWKEKINHCGNITDSSILPVVYTNFLMPRSLFRSHYFDQATWRLKHNDTANNANNANNANYNKFLGAIDGLQVRSVGANYKISARCWYKGKKYIRKDTASVPTSDLYKLQCADTTGKISASQ